MSNSNLDEKNASIAAALIAARAAITEPTDGDFVRFATGELERIVTLRDNRMQTAPNGSFFMYSNGYADFSGGLNPPIPPESLKATEETLEGEFWFYNHGNVGHRRTDFMVQVRVFETSVPHYKHGLKKNQEQ